MFFAVASALLPVLRDGDARLPARLEREVAEGLRELGLAPGAMPVLPGHSAHRERKYAQRRLPRLFSQSVTGTGAPPEARSAALGGLGILGGTGARTPLVSRDGIDRGDAVSS